MSIDVVNAAKEMVSGGKLIYLSKSGSKLYGTDTPESDSDYKGVFIPSKEDMLIGKAKHHISYNTSNQNQKNTKNDIDIELKSVHTFLNELSNGDTGAYDLAFSYTNKNAVLVCEPEMMMFHENIKKFYHPKNIKNFIGFAYSQAKKYSVKGDKVVLLDKIISYLESHEEQFRGKRIMDFQDDFLKNFNDDKSCYAFKDEFNTYIQLFEKKYVVNNKYEYFIERVRETRNSYGRRAEEVAKKVLAGCPSADWKALSHAYRCAYEAFILIYYGRIDFPLERRDIIKDIKLGVFNLEKVTKMIDFALRYLDVFMQESNIEDKYDESFIKSYILSLYD